MGQTIAGAVCESFCTEWLEEVIAVPVGDDGNTVGIELRFNGHRLRVDDSELQEKFAAFELFCTHESNHTVLYEYNLRSVRCGMVTLKVNDYEGGFSREALKRILDEFARIVVEMYDEEDALE